jgi:hypothetical protein
MSQELTETDKQARLDRLVKIGNYVQDRVPSEPMSPYNRGYLEGLAKGEAKVAVLEKKLAAMWLKTEQGRLGDPIPDH